MNRAIHRNALGSVQWVTRRFWPIANDHVWHVLQSASWMQQRGWSVEVLTACWHNSWPARVSLRELSVTRLAPSPTTPFRSRRYARALSERLSALPTYGPQHWPRTLIVDATDEDAMHVVDHVGRHAPHSGGLTKSVVRYDLIDGAGPLSGRLRQRALQVCEHASEVVVPHEAARRELLAAGITPGRIGLVSEGPWQPIARHAAVRSEARRSLSSINYELFLRSDDRLVICLAELTKTSGVEFVIEALGPILQTERAARLWVIGDGPERLRLYDLIKRYGWRSDVLMPGSFEDPELLLAAADLCIVPSPSQGCRWLMPTALLSGLPTLLCTGPAILARLEGCASPLTYETGSVQQLQQHFRRWLKDSSYLQSATAAAADHLRSAPTHG